MAPTDGLCEDRRHSQESQRLQSHVGHAGKKCSCANTARQDRASLDTQAPQMMLGLRSGAARQLVSLLAEPRGITRAVTAFDATVSGQHMSSGPKTATPPPNAARGATADLCDIYVTDPVDIVSQRDVQIMDPIFK